MHMAAEQTDNLRMATYDIGERIRLLGPAVATDIVIADVEWRMVNKQQRRPVRLLG